MNDMKIVEKNNDEITIELNNAIKVKFILENFKKDGEMEVDYDEELLTEQEASQLVTSYFDSLLKFIQDNEERITGEIIND